MIGVPEYEIHHARNADRNTTYEMKLPQWKVDLWIYGRDPVTMLVLEGTFDSHVHFATPQCNWFHEKQNDITVQAWLMTRACP
jgi:hypothetical protein